MKSPNTSKADTLSGPSFLPNLKSGFTLFLIALPLSIGIALASGAPPSAGLLAAIVGGIVGSWLGGAELTINGPAAGLIVVVLGAVESLGQGNAVLGFQCMLAATIAAGGLQVLMGVLRLASLGLAFPSAVIHGMLSAIGAIIIAKQIPVLLGVKATAKSIFGLLGEVPHDILHLNPDIALIGVASLTLLFLIPKIPFSFAKKVPAPLVVVLFGVALGEWFDIHHSHTVQFLNWSGEINEGFLLNIPQNIRDVVVLPNFSRFFTMANAMAVLSIALIASIESVLSTVAVDKLDPKKRTSNLNRDLLSKGVCNMVLGAIGGLPIISEIVRSSANIDNGATGKMSNFLHGIFILLFLALFPAALHEIPLACLAAILIFVGWRLTHPSHFLHAAHIGPDHMLSFLTTFVMTLATDLLLGVAAGVVVEILIALVQGVNPLDLFRLQYQESVEGDTTKIEVQSSVIFTNSLKLCGILEGHLSGGRHVVIDFSESRFIDHTVMDQLARFHTNFSVRGLKLEKDLDRSHRPFSKHPLAAQRKRSIERGL